MAYTLERHGLSKRKACRLVGLQTSTLHYKTKRQRSDEPIKEAIAKVVEKKSFAGLPRVVEALRDQMGFTDNHKRIARIYREMKMQIGKRSKKRRVRLRLALPTPTKPNELWAMDFVLDSLATGRRFRCLNVKDLFTHEAIVIEVARSITGEDVARALDRVANERGYPEGIICDNGTEYTSIAMDRWAFRTNVKLNFIQPGKPIQNAFIESFNAIFRNECLNLHWFESLESAKEIIESWRTDYNFDRTQKRLGKKTPIQFANYHEELLREKTQTMRLQVVQ